LFDEVAARRGAATALRSDAGEMSYADLASRIDRIAHGLTATGVKHGDRVALFLERSPDAIASLYAVMKCGATCVPLDPEYPLDRLHFLVADSGASLAVCEGGWVDRLPKGLASFTPDRLARDGEGRGAFTCAPVKADDAASILYTSGSTGTPKGALIPHRAMVRLVRNSDFIHFGEDETFLFAASPCFDASILEIHGALLNGGVLAIPAPGQLTLDAITTALTKHQVSTVWITAGLFQIMDEECPEAFAGLKQLITGGDVMSPAHAAKVLALYPNLCLVNGYGPTENTTFTTTHRVTEDDLNATSIPVGRPIANTTVFLLDSNLHPVQPGVPGELCAGGDGLALGYLNRPELSAEKFTTLSGKRIYRTGDLCRQRADGSIVFQGRIDHQVKIRGFRVELGEIESCLGRHPLVGQCKVLVRGENAADKSLAAYVTPLNGVKPAPAELVGYLRAKLPDYLVPASIAVLDVMPLNANGKIDSRALAAAGTSTVEEERERPLTETESDLTAIWRDLLKTNEVGLDDDFFCLGGHSLLGMKMFSRLQKRFEVSLPLAVLFRAPTVRQLAALIDQRMGTSAPEVDPVIGDTVPGPRKGGFHATIETSSGPLAETTVAIQPKGDLPPLFAVHGGDGGILFYGNLAERLGEERPFYAFEAPALTATSPIPDESVEETACHYLEELRKVQAAGPYYLCGYSFGGVVAYDMARQLIDAGEQVEFLGLVDTENPAVDARKLSFSERVAVNWNKRTLAEKGAIGKVGHIGMRFGTGLAYRLYFEAEDAVARTLPQAKGAGWLRQVQLRKSHERSMAVYHPAPIAGKLTLFRAMVGGDKYELGEDYGWNELVDELEIVDIPGNHVTVFHKENIDAIAAAFRAALGNVVVNP
jgi:amino acid adenylation domain-containing protein